MSAKEKLSLILENHPNDSRVKIREDGICQTLSQRMGTGGGNTPLVLEGNGSRPSHRGDGYKESEVMYTLNTVETHAVCDTVVRRLTPLECERLQGFPDGWSDIGEWVDSKGKKRECSDGLRYKLMGNSIALPFWRWLAERMTAQLKADGEENPTMCSLFDGAAGFPLVFNEAGCKPVWASEIEDFPTAVSKYHFPESEEEDG